MSFKEKLKNLQTKLSQIYIAMKSPKTSWYAKIMACITICYALSPIDLIPDFIPILGYLDDIIILPLMIWITIKMISRNIWNSFEDEAKDIWKDGKPRKWFLAIPIIFIWVSLFAFIIWSILT